MKFKELAGIEKSHCWARGWVWGRWGTGVCVGVSWGECSAILGRIGRMSGFLVGYFRFRFRFRSFKDDDFGGVGWVWGA